MSRSCWKTHLLQRWTVCAALLWGTIAIFPLDARAQAQPVGEPMNLLSNGDFGRGTDNWAVPEERATASVIEAQAGPFKRALRVQAEPLPGSPPQAISLRQPVAARLVKGQSLVLKAWLRSPESGRVGIYVEEKDAPYTKSLAATLTLTPEWKEYEIKGEALADFPTEGANLVLYLGLGKATIELTGIRLFDPKAPAAPVGISNASPQNPQPVIANGDFALPLQGTFDMSANVLQSELVEATGLPPEAGEFKRMARLTSSLAVEGEPYRVGFGQKSKSFIARDDAIYLRVWLRSPQSIRVGLAFELATAPNTKTISQTAQLSPAWKEFRFVGYAAQAFAPGDAQFRMFLAHDKGTVEMAGLRVQNFGRAPREMFSQTIDYWGGRAHTDDWRAPALQRIEAIRKGDLTIRVVDAQGKPVPDARVHVEQQKHWFRFGTAGPVSRLIDNKSPDSLRYQAEVKKLFNTFVFESDLKWPPSEMPGRLEQIDAGIAWLKANGIDNIRAHNMVWGSKKYLPARVADADAAGATTEVRARVLNIGKRYAGQVYVWDVVNEAANNTELWEKIGWDKFAEVYSLARQADPNALLAYNDYHAFNSPENIFRKAEDTRIQQLIDAKVPLDILGEQAHIGTPLLPIDVMLQRLDELARFGKRIEITEFDVGVVDDTIHGDYTRDFLIATFSHPKVDAFVMWGFWEGAHWRAKDGGAMFRRDWTPRPAATAYEDLVLKQWWTRADVQSNAQGTASTRAFYGTQLVSVESNGRQTSQTVLLRPDQPAEFVLKLP